jgi:hypothetical protein
MCLRPRLPGSRSVVEGVDLPQRGEARWGAALQAAGRGETAVPAVPPSNLPPLGGGYGHTAADHNAGRSL